MTTAHHRHHPSVGELLIAGDWACAHGDLSTLRYLAQQMAPYMRDPMHDKLLDLAELCQEDADRAYEEWAELRAQL